MSLSYTYEDVKNEFEKRGFILQSNEYKNCKEKLLCLDKQGYKLLTSLDNILKHNKSKAGTRRFHPSNLYSIENINHYAEINKLLSRCISKEYINSKSPLNFRCGCGELFCTSWDTFHFGHKTKCDICSNNPFANKDYDSVKDTLAKLGYYLDVNKDEYLGVTLTPLICHDKFGYKYKLTYDAILRGKVPSPVAKNNIFSIDNINTYLKNNNKEFTCISNEFIDRDYLLEFICERCGETIFAKWSNMYKCDNSNNTRNILLCPNCDGRTESVHALVLKQMFKYYYPDTIEEEKSCINPLTGCIMPTDIVNHRLKIAIEIQSEWHDKEYQKIKDKIKKDFWINKGYKFYDPDIRNFTILGMCQLFFDIKELPEWINFDYSNKWNIKNAQNLLDKNLSPNDVAKELGINVHQIYDAIGCGKLHYSDTYINKSYTPIVEVDKNNNIIDFFTTIKNGAEKYNLNPGSLASSLLEGRHDFGNHIWYYAKDLA